MVGVFVTFLRGAIKIVMYIHTEMQARVYYAVSKHVRARIHTYIGINTIAFAYLQMHEYINTLLLGLHKQKYINVLTQEYIHACVRTET